MVLAVGAGKERKASEKLYETALEALSFSRKMYNSTVVHMKILIPLNAGELDQYASRLESFADKTPYLLCMETRIENMAVAKGGCSPVFDAHTEMAEKIHEPYIMPASRMKYEFCGELRIYASTFRQTAEAMRKGEDTLQDGFSYEYVLNAAVRLNKFAGQLYAYDAVMKEALKYLDTRILK